MAERTTELVILARYNAWANAAVFSLARTLPPTAVTRKDDYESVGEILRHLVHVESSFWLMSLGRERVRVQGTDLGALASRSTEVDRGIEELAERASEMDLSREFLVPWFGFNVTVREALLQALTHSQKHRADVCMLLPKLGVAVPDLDLIQWIAESRPEIA